jgi:hypothetical protein
VSSHRAVRVCVEIAAVSSSTPAGAGTACALLQGSSWPPAAALRETKETEMKRDKKDEKIVELTAEQLEAVSGGAGGINRPRHHTSNTPR